MWSWLTGSTPPSDDAKEKNALSSATPPERPIEDIDDFVIVEMQPPATDIVKTAENGTQSNAGVTVTGSRTMTAILKAAKDSVRSNTNSSMRRVSSLPQFTHTLTFATNWAAKAIPPTPPNTPVQTTREKSVKLSAPNLFKTGGNESDYDRGNEQEKKNVPSPDMD